MCQSSQRDSARSNTTFEIYSDLDVDDANFEVHHTKLSFLGHPTSNSYGKLGISRVYNRSVSLRKIEKVKPFLIVS